MSAGKVEVETVSAVSSPRLVFGKLSRDAAIMCALVLLGVFAAGVRFNDQLVGLSGDNATYILLARDLVTGQPYESAGYPWGYPALMAPIVAAVGTDNLIGAIPWLKLLTVLLYLVSLPLMYALFRTRQSPVASFAVVLLFAVNAGTLFYANDILSELPYICASYGALLYWQKAVAPWAYDRNVKAVPWATLLSAGVLLLLPYYIRTVGIALLAAPVLVLLLYRKWRAAGALGLMLALGALPWVLWSRNGTLNNYTNQLLLRDPYNPSLGSISDIGELAGRVISTANLYVTQVFPQQMVIPAPMPSIVQTVLGPIFAALMLIGLVLWLVRRVELPEVYALLFSLVLFVWPWTGDRFILPIYPLMLFYTLEGGLWLVRLVSQRLQRARKKDEITAQDSKFKIQNSKFRPSIILLLIALILTLPHLWRTGVAGAENLRYLQGQAPIASHTPDWNQFFAANEWLKQNTPPGSVVMSRKSTLTDLYANRPSLQIPLIPPDQYPAFLRANHVAYILEDGFEWSTHTRNYLRPALKDFPDRFELVGEFGPPETRVWRVK